jgi:putative SOS response-associated peptidase YedK
MMCGRYAAAKDPNALAEEFEVASVPDEVLAPDFNVAPTKKVYIVVDKPRDDDFTVPVREGHAGASASELERAMVIARWGLVPSWAKDPSIASHTINARAETVAEKPSFRSAFAKRRCLVPADGYYEWYQGPPQGPGGIPQKQPFYIHSADGSTLAMAGLYEWWREPGPQDAWRLTCSIITMEATSDVARIHNRMPLTIRPDAWERWLDPEVSAAEISGLMRPAPLGSFVGHPVSSTVNAVRNNGPSLLDEVEMADDPQAGLF